MEIGIDVSPLQSGHRFRGIGSYTRGLLWGLAQLDTGDRYVLYHWKGLRLDVDQQGLPKNIRWAGIPFPRLGRASALVAQQLLLLPQLLVRRPDLYHQLGVVADPSAGGLPWAFLDRSVVTVHDLTPLVFYDRFLKGKRAREFVYRLMLEGVRRSRQVLANSAATRRDLIRFLGLQKHQVLVVPLAVAPSLLSALQSPVIDRLPGLPPGPYILTVAGDYPNKNLSTLLEAYTSLAVEGNAPDLVLVGPHGPAASNFERRHPALATHVKILQQLDEIALAAAYRHATIVVVPSEYEGFGLPVLEAMAAGAPVIASNASSLPEVAGDAAVLIPPYDHVAMASAMRSLLEDPGARACLRSRGLEWAAQFSWERAAASTHCAYRRAVHLPSSRVASEKTSDDQTGQQMGNTRG